MNGKESSKSESLNMDIQVEPFFELDEEMTKGLKGLLSAIGPILNYYPVRSLRSVLLLPQAEMADMINRLLTGTDSEKPYTASTYAPTGTAVPIEDENGDCYCYILLAQELVTPLTSEKFLPRETVSTVVEEFLHVYLYERAWERRGALRELRLDDCDKLIYDLVGRAADEYQVLRLKTQLLGTLELVNDGEGGRMSVGIRYGGDLNELPQQAISAIKTVTHKASMGELTVNEAWPLICNALYRGILEPLSRNAGALDAYSDSEPLHYMPSHPIVRIRLLSLWESMHSQLRQMNDFPEKSEEALRAITASVWKFLSSLGITRHLLHAGGCYLKFESHLFDRMLDI